jgi:hypothetical protein
MPRTETVLQIFVASPGDLSDERRALDDVVGELNATWERTLGIRLDLWRWETCGYPGVSSDPQAVINVEVPLDYDIFVGLMWARFGTATPRAGSGTEEEFLAAKARHEGNPSSVHIMFYFKETPLLRGRSIPRSYRRSQHSERPLAKKACSTGLSILSTNSATSRESNSLVSFKSGWHEIAHPRRRQLRCLLLLRSRHLSRAALCQPTPWTKSLVF